MMKKRKDRQLAVNNSYHVTTVNSRLSQADITKRRWEVIIIGFDLLCPYIIGGFYSDSQFLLPSVLLKSGFPLVDVLHYGLITSMGRR